jgi:glycine dehydrogenase
MNFENRHIGVSELDKNKMLNDIGIESLDKLIKDTIPENILLKDKLNLPDSISEQEWLKEANDISKLNENLKTYIGMGYYGTITPPVILRNVFENPGWYTSYTPYQAEISQGRLEALLNFQTMVMDLTGMEMSNASLLDESTAAAESMIMLFSNRKRDLIKKGSNKFFVDINVFPQTIEVLKTRSKSLGIELIIDDILNYDITEGIFGAIIQYPNKLGEIIDYSQVSDKLNSIGAELVVASDLMSLTLITEPSKIGASVVVGSTQRFGVPIGFGGPHAAFFACKEKYKRSIPGRIIGVSKDTKGNKAYRMALQTREQHIKREKATSNICTAQALLAVMASMYSVYHGPDGIKEISTDIATKTKYLSDSLNSIGFVNKNKNYFDTICLEYVDGLREILEDDNINLNYNYLDKITISVDETTTYKDINDIIFSFSKLSGGVLNLLENKNELGFNRFFKRESDYLTNPVFNSYHSETEMMRYLKRLENKDISLTNSMISLGSCTMKLNSASEMMPLSNPSFNSLHPFVPESQSYGYKKVIDDLSYYLKEVTGFSGVSFQPNSGAQGEYAGLAVIKGYLDSIGQTNRNIVLIPSSAHGTNPASAVMAGLKVVVVKCDELGDIDINDLKEKVEQNKNELAALMVTYPSTHGVFEEKIVTINEIIHENGGQVYMDGANMNAQVGLTNPYTIGADVCHLNLHKTFAIPHGGGGPGMGPILVSEHLTPFLPSNNNKLSIGSVASSTYSSALILLISLGYVRMLGKDGLRKSTEYAILNANYIKSKLSKHYDILYTNKNGMVAHEMILDCRGFKKYGIDVMDIAKRLIDYGFHSPTVSFPVAGTLMIEPTESESKRELDLFIESMISIKKEINEVIDGVYDKEDNVLVNSPHTFSYLITDKWNHSYSREKASFPLEHLRQVKYWSPVSRIDNAYGDRNLVCSCDGMETYEV